MTTCTRCTASAGTIKNKAQVKSAITVDLQKFVVIIKMMFENNGDPILNSLKRFTVVLITCHIMRCKKLIISIKCCFRANFWQLNDIIKLHGKHHGEFRS